MSRAQIAEACHLDDNVLARVEAGEDGVPGELQDYLTEQGENVGWMASQQAALITSTRKQSRKRNE
jgi:hypothetical protein